MNNIPMCKLGLEPLSNFICPHCLYRSVQQWLWRFKPSIIEGFMDFHRKFTETIVSDKTAFCVSCKRDYYHMVCPYDYIKEVHAWLEGHLNEKRLKEFLRIFSLGFRKIERHLERGFFYRNHGPLQKNHRTDDIGICENCENFSDNLRRDASNRIVCEKCR